MTIKYWTGFSKRKNSTAQPSTGTDCVVALKDACSIINPIFESATMPVDANYIYVSDWNRYYFVTNVTYKTNIIKVFSCEVDVLASYKSQIGSTVARVEFASDNYNVNIIDPRINVTGNKNIYASTPQAMGFSNVGCYILGVVNDLPTSGKQGALSYYIMNALNVGILVKTLMDGSFDTQISQYFSGKLMDMIASCIWIPIDIVTAAKMFSNTPPATPNLNTRIGSIDVPAESYPVDTTVATLEVGGYQSVAVPIPYKWQDFRDLQPYTSASLYLPGIGDTDININDFYNSQNVSINTKVDCTTGDILYRIFEDNGNILKTIKFNGGFPVALSHVTTNAAGALGSVGGIAGGMLAGGVSIATGNVVGLIGSGVGVATAAGSAIMQANRRATSIWGANAGRTAFAVTTAHVTLVCLETEDPDDADYIARMGRPVCVTHAISTHSGYVQTSNGSVENVGSPIEKDRVNGYINTGFYYE